MDNIFNHTDEISSLNAREDIVTGPISRKYYEIDSIRDVVTEMVGGDGLISISRQNIFQEGDPRKRIIKTLIWGYPNDVRNTPKILERTTEISELVQRYRHQEIRGADFFSNLLNIQSMGPSTASKLAYFFEIEIENIPCVIVDQVVLTGFSLLTEFRDLKDVSNTSKYQNAITAINNVKEQMNQKPEGLSIKNENIEFYLFKLGRKWREYEKKQVAALKERDNTELFKSWISQGDTANNNDNGPTNQEVATTQDSENSPKRKEVNLKYSNKNGRALIYSKKLSEAIHECWNKGGEVVLALQDEDKILIKHREPDYTCFRQKEINTWAKNKEQSGGLKEGDTVAAILYFRQNNNSKLN